MTQRGFIVKVNTATPDPPDRRPIQAFTVKTGDSLDNIAAQFGLTANTVRWSNGLTDDGAVLPGRVLLIPPANGVLVKVDVATNLAALASQYRVTAQDIIDYNYIRDPSHLVVGSFVMVPDGQGPPITRRAASSPRTVTFSNETVVYYGAVYGSSNRFPWGYCTWWVANKRPIPWSGNAYEWWWQARQFGFAEGQVPKVGAIMVQGISAWSPVGHVAYVESVNRDGSFTVSEMNYGRWGVVDFRTITSLVGLDLLGFIY
jgi:surface antigen